jgi:hypothetical protein
VARPVLAAADLVAGLALSDTSPTSSDIFKAPSWSWLRATGPVYYHNATHSSKSPAVPEQHKSTDLKPFTRIVSVESTTLPGTASICGTLTISGLSFRYHLTANDLKELIFKSWNARKLDLNIGRWMLDRPAELPLGLECVIIAEDTVAKMLVCLCIVPHEGKRRRIGLCHWDSLT